ncbi:hypothetical protein L7F22_028366 [Adiantum nelumboides]|nr:hypothetical protein [Adiantum nelumboides]
MRFGLGDFSWSEFLPRMKPKRQRKSLNMVLLVLSTLPILRYFAFIRWCSYTEHFGLLPCFPAGSNLPDLRCPEGRTSNSGGSSTACNLAFNTGQGKKCQRFTQGSPFSDDVYKRLPGLVNARFWKEPQDWKFLQVILKHGYGRWQEIIEDAESDLKSSICEELQLSASGSASMHDGSRSPTKAPCHDGVTFLKEEVSGQGMCINANPAGGQEDGGIGFSASDRPDEHRIYKRMVEFLKKRVVLLERALNAEYHQESLDESKVEAEAMEDGGQTGSQAGIDAEEPHSFLTLLAPEEISAYAYDNEPRRLKVARIYNEICRTINECEMDAAETYTGNNQQGLVTRSCMVRNVLGKKQMPYQRNWMKMKPSSTLMVKGSKLQLQSRVEDDNRVSRDSKRPCCFQPSEQLSSTLWLGSFVTRGLAYCHSAALN